MTGLMTEVVGFFGGGGSPYLFFARKITRGVSCKIWPFWG